MAATASVLDGSDRAQQRHVLHVGYLRRPAPAGLDCESPLRVTLSDDDGRTWAETWRCSNHRESKCRPCATRYRRRVQAVAADGLYRRGGFYYLLTLTAPGSAAHSLPSGRRCRCTPAGGVDLARWNADAGRSWNRLLLAVERQYLVRPRYFRAAEVQERGAIHHHVLVHSPRKLSVRTLRPLAIAAGYGHEIDLQPLTPGSRKAAFYVSKYVTKSADLRAEVPWWGQYVEQGTGEVLYGHTAATFRTWSQSRSWGSSMASIREVERVRFLEKSSSAPSSTADVSGESPPAPS